MRELVYENVRIQFLSEEVIRLEGRYGEYFTDQGAFWNPERSGQILLGELRLILPDPGEGLKGLRIYRDCECVYSYEKMEKSGKLPAPSQTPWIYALEDTDAKVVYFLICKKDARKLREEYVLLTGRPDMRREAVWGDWRMEDCLATPSGARNSSVDAGTPDGRNNAGISENFAKALQDRKNELPYFNYPQIEELPEQQVPEKQLQRAAQECQTLRHRLLPMLYRNVYESWESGMPILRRLDWEYPQDKRVTQYLHEFMIGDLLIVPEKEKPEAYLPEGLWLYPWTGKVYQGKRCPKPQKPSGQPELYIRLGAVLILAEDTDCAGEQDWEHLTMDYYPCKECPKDGFLYEDDRKTDAYKNGEYRKTYYHTSYDGNRRAYGLSISDAEGSFEGRFAWEKRTLRIRCHELLGERVKQIFVNGSEQSFERILKSKEANVLETKGASPDSDVAELVIEHKLSECVHVDFVME